MASTMVISNQTTTITAQITENQYPLSISIEDGESEAVLMIGESNVPPIIAFVAAIAPFVAQITERGLFHMRINDMRLERFCCGGFTKDGTQINVTIDRSGEGDPLDVHIAVFAITNINPKEYPPLPTPRTADEVARIMYTALMKMNGETCDDDHHS